MHHKEVWKWKCKLIFFSLSWIGAGRVNEVSGSWKAPHEFRKICKQLYQLRIISQHLCGVHRIRQQLRSSWNSQTIFMKFVEVANNFIKFVGLVNNFRKVRKTCKNFMKFADWTSDLSGWKFFFKFHSLKYFNW